MYTIKWQDLSLIDETGASIIFPESYLCDKRLFASKWDVYKNFFDDLEKENVRWIFRGLPDKKYKLATSLERTIQDGSKRIIIYPKLIEKFKESCHLYLDQAQIPELHDFLEIQSLMQHFGSPTRLLDWTYSWKIAAFFAASKFDDTDFTVYAINESWLLFMTHRMLQEKLGLYSGCKIHDLNESQYFNYIHNQSLSDNHGFILPIRSRRENIRQLQQKGIFTFQGNIRFGFSYNLINTIQYGLDKEIINNSDLNMIIKRFDIPRSFSNDLMDFLYSINISNRTLFPGIEGFARSLNEEALDYISKLNSLERSSDKIRNIYNDELL